jgi:hypothetical protein
MKRSIGSITQKKERGLIALRLLSVGFRQVFVVFAVVF